MDVLEIVKVQTDHDGYTIFAIVDNMEVLYEQTMWDPAEYCPALCKAYLLSDDGQHDLPTKDDELLAYINDCDLSWTQVG